MGTVRPEDEHPRIALGHDLEQRIDRMRAAHAQALDPNGERMSELGGLQQLPLEILALDVSVSHEAPVRGMDLRDVDEDEWLPCLDRGVDRKGGSRVGERNVEGSEQDGARPRRAGRDVFARAAAPNGLHDYSGWSSQRGDSRAVRRYRRRQ
jgi:hypothetical protein